MRVLLNGRPLKWTTLPDPGPVPQVSFPLSQTADMASTSVTEKRQEAIGVEHAENNSTSSAEEKLRKVPSTGVDPENREAVKGDDSDGKVDWNFKSITATCCLAGLYVGRLQA